jgi:hypothetical protein
MLIASLLQPCAVPTLQAEPFMEQALSQVRIICGVSDLLHAVSQSTAAEQVKVT